MVFGGSLVFWKYGVSRVSDGIWWFVRVLDIWGFEG